MEYALLVTAIATVIVFIVFALGGLVRSMFDTTCADIDAQSSINATDC